MNMPALYWDEPLWLLLALQPVVIFLLRWLHDRKQLRRYANPALHPWVIGTGHSNWRRRLLNRNTSYLLAWLCIAIAAAGPKTIEDVPDNTTSHGVDIMAVVDISRSMHIQDTGSPRLLRAKQELLSLVPLLQKDRLGIIVYAARPHQYMPLSFDTHVMQHYLDNLDKLSPPTEGSRPSEALRLAEQLLQKQNPDNNRNQAILLISDGENLDLSTTSGVPIFVLGVGSIEGDAVPGYEGDWLRDNNQVIVSRLHEDELKKIAQQSNGSYSRSYKGNGDWAKLYSTGIQSLTEKTNIQNDDKITWHELYKYALLPGLFLLLLSNIRFVPAKPSSATSTPLSSLIILLLGAVLAPLPDAHANDSGSAYKAFANNDYLSALEQYRSIEGYRGRFGEGASAYRLKDSANAIAAFNQAFLHAEDDTQRAMALYNLGNSHFLSGDYLAATNSFRDVLLYQPDNQLAQRNLVFSQDLHATVQKRLRRLEKLLTPGRGPKPARAAPNTELGNDTSISVDESNDELERASHTEITYASILSEQLILKGIEHAKLAGGEQLTPQASLTTIVQKDLTSSRLRLENIRDDQAAFWRRILEVEEEFPAPLVQPRTIKGVKAW